MDGSLSLLLSKYNVRILEFQNLKLKSIRQIGQPGFNMYAKVNMNAVHARMQSNSGHSIAVSVFLLLYLLTN